MSRLEFVGDVEGTDWCTDASPAMHSALIFLKSSGSFSIAADALRGDGEARLRTIADRCRLAVDLVLHG